MVEIGDVEEDEDEDVEVVVVGGGDEVVVLTPRLHTKCETSKQQEDVEEWHIQQGLDTLHQQEDSTDRLPSRQTHHIRTS